MIVRAIIWDSLKNLSANLLRSGLTMLGVIIGVASVIAMIAIVEGGQVWLVKSIERLGTNLLFVWKKSLTVEEQRKFAGRSTGLRYGDALAVRKRFPEITPLPIIELDQQLKAGDRDFSGEVTGTWPEYQDVRNFRPGEGRFLIQADIEEWNCSKIELGTIRPSFPAGNNNAWPLPEPWSISQPSCWLTNRPEISIAAPVGKFCRCLSNSTRKARPLS